MFRLVLFIVLFSNLCFSQEQILNKKNQEKTKEINYPINTALMDFYKKWKNVKYKFGGNSKTGIDCSAFIKRLFHEKFNLNLPRTTLTQVKIGEPIKKAQLKVGDLIFFKTGKNERHVGVYIGKGKFMHASIKGVKFTNLNKPFYKRTYWTSRRILLTTKHI